MSDKIEIIVVARDDASKTFKSIEGNAKSSGERTGDNFSKGASSNMGKEIEKGFTGIRKNLERDGLKSGENIGKSFSGAIIGSTVKLASSLGKAGVEAGTKLGTSISEGAVSTLESTGPGGAAVGAAIIGVGLAAAPALGALLSGAIIGGAGIGGIIGGLMLVKDDPALAAAGSQISKRIMSQLKISASSMIAPAIAGLNTIEGAFNRSTNDLKRFFDNSSQFISPLADAIGYAIESISSGIADLTEGAGPVIDGIANGIMQIADSFKDGFSKLSEDGPAAGAAISEAFGTVARILDAVFWTVDKLTDAFGWLAEHGVLGDSIKQDFEDYKAGMNDVTASTDNLRTSTQIASDALKEMADTLRAETDPVFALIKAQQDLNSAQSNYEEAVRKSGKGSKEAQDALLGLGTATTRVADASIAAADSSSSLPDSFKAAAKAAGLSADEVSALADQFTRAKNRGDAFDGTYVATVKTVYQTIGQRSAAYGGGFSFTGHAAGGVIGAAASGGSHGGMTLVGEEGPELVSLPYGSSVSTAGATKRKMAEGDVGGSGSGTVKVTLEVKSGSDSMFATTLQKLLDSGAITLKQQYVRS